MNLIFDIGNSGTKMAVFDGRVKISSFRSREFSCEKLEKKLSGYNIDRAIISSVRELPEYIIDLLRVNIPEIHVLTYRTGLPFKINYNTPETLGSDRIAAAAGAYSLYPGAEILLIDAGSAITFDYLSGENFLGGNISPGITMRFRALHRFTGRLPLISPDEAFSDPGKNTKDAITAGVIKGVVYEINEYIRTFKKNNRDCRVILTGGDGAYLRNKINDDVTYLPEIVLDGLNYVLEYNAQ